MKEPSHVERIAEQCRQIGLFRNAYNKLPESLWYACIGVTSHADGGTEFSFEYSIDAFSEQEIKEAIEFSQDLSPTTCERFQSLNPEGCEGCPHKGQLVSPIQLGTDARLHATESELEESPPEAEARPTRILEGDRNEYLGPRGGSLAGWTRAGNQLFAAGFEPQSFGLLCSFAAPLMRFFPEGEGGSVVSTFSSQSRSARTLAVKAAASVWGQQRGTELGDEDIKSAVWSRDIPATYEHISRLDPERAASFIERFTASNQSILILAAPSSLQGLGSAILEFKADLPRGHFNRHEGAALERDLFTNAGWAGDEYMRYLVDPAVGRYISESLRDRSAQILDTTGLREEHQSWIRTIAAVAVAGTIVRHLGILDFSLNRIIQWALKG